MAISLASVRGRPRVVLAVAALSLLAFEMADTCSACTIVVKADPHTVLVGNNEDYLEPRTKIWFFPAASGAHGRIIWGFDRALWPYQGGMNDRGLFVDINAVAPTGYASDSKKPDLPGDEIEYFLSHCATVDEAVDVFRRYNVGLDSVKFVFADAGGTSAIIEWLDGRMNVVRRRHDYQVSTNSLSTLEHAEPRNQISQRILGSQKEPTVAVIRRALAASAFAAPFGQTLYSTICDLKARRVLLYHFHDFEECVTFDLDDELRKGEASYAIPSLFAVRPYSEELFLHGAGSQVGAKDLLDFILANGAQKGAARLQEMAAETRTYNRYVFEEWILRDVGMILRSQGKVKEAVAVFELNTQRNPESWETYYDLAEACAAQGDSEAAQRNYRLALEHRPDPAHVADIKEKLGTERT